MNTLLITIVVAAIIGAAIFMKARKMTQFIIVQEDGKWFVKVRRGLGYRYLEQTEDLPGYANDVFETSKVRRGPLKSKEEAESLIVNYRMTTVNGIEIEGE